MSNVTALNTTPALNIMVEQYIKLRDTKAQLKAEFAKRTGPLQEAMDKLEGAILAHMNATGIESCRTSAGTAYKATDCKATVADWDVVLAYIREHGLWHMLEKRVSKNAVEEFVETNNDLPPGVNYTAEVVVNVRRS